MARRRKKRVSHRRKSRKHNPGKRHSARHSRKGMHRVRGRRFTTHRRRAAKGFRKVRSRTYRRSNPDVGLLLNVGKAIGAAVVAAIGGGMLIDMVLPQGTPMTKNLALVALAGAGVLALAGSPFLAAGVGVGLLFLPATKIVGGFLPGATAATPAGLLYGGGQMGLLYGGGALGQIDGLTSVGPAFSTPAQHMGDAADDALLARFGLS